jgi:NAD(P)-dependent dehydrogenase (short-subunit alcohol dehydrogenase family)
MNGFDGKTVLITGGSSGFGLTTAEMLVAGGARVLITGRHAETLAAARSRLGGRLLTAVADTTSLDDIDALAGRARAEFGALDALFVNAGVNQVAPFEAVPEDVYDAIFAVNAKGAYFTVQRLAPVLRDGGSIVLTTSVANVKGNPMMSAYAASKAALRSMTRSFARELLPRGIRVNAISPGPIETGVIDRSLTPELAVQARAMMTENNPMQRFGESSEIASAFGFLAFDATYTTGAELPVDGGVSQL